MLFREPVRRGWELFQDARWSICFQIGLSSGNKVGFARIYSGAPNGNRLLVCSFLKRLGKCSRKSDQIDLQILAESFFFIESELLGSAPVTRARVPALRERASVRALVESLSRSDAVTVAEIQGAPRRLSSCGIRGKINVLRLFNCVFTATAATITHTIFGVSALPLGNSYSRFHTLKP